MCRTTATTTFYQTSGILQPLLVLLQRDHAAVTLCFLLSGLFAPGVKFFCRDPPGLDPGETPLVLSAIDLEHLIVRPFFRPLDDGAHVLASPTFRIDWPLTVFCRTASRNGEVAAAVLANPYPLLPFDRFPQEELD